MLIALRTASPSPDDIGALKAEIVFFEPRFRDEIVYLSGDTVTYDEVAGLLERVLGRPFKRIVPRRCGAETDGRLSAVRARFSRGWN
jgi:hypothetical protein